MSQALYRKYRSKKLSEIVGQEHITRTLENALKSGKISHAYLFTGPRGVGKTSIARILAHEINQLPYSEEATHLDIIEIDAASNRGVEDIRSLREKVHVAPASAKYKVYIIDEAHMLTKEAFNALLKTLEEPPAHVVFILATTEIHKMPETIISRTQRFTFKPIEEAAAIRHLRSIAESEGISIDDDALKLLADHGRGSFRDSIGLLDQIGHGKKRISRTDAEKLLGIAAGEHISRLLNAVDNGTPADILTALDSLTEDGINPAQAARQLSAVLRRRILDGNSGPSDIGLLGDLLEVSASSDPAGKLEVVLIETNLKSAPAAVKAEAPAAEPVLKTPKPAAETREPVPEIVTAAEIEAAGENSAGDDWWNDVLSQLKGVNNTLYGVMRMARPKIDGDVLKLGFNFGLHAKKVAEADTQAKIHAAVSKVTGKSFQISAEVDKTKTAEPKKKPADTGQHLDSVKNIFGGGEVLES